MISPSARLSHQRFARALLQAMRLAGLPVAGTAAFAFGCGGNVVLDTGSGGGSVAVGAGGAVGEGGSVTSNVSASTSIGAGGSSTFTCDVPTPGGETSAYACLNGSAAPCLSIDSSTLYDQLSQQLYQPNGCAGTELTEILCGPDPTTNSCCYYVALGPVGCEGRPFTVEGRARTAPAVARAGFSLPAAPDLSGLDAPTRRALAAAWERDARYEHASIASFARFALQLLAAGAPAALLADTQRAMGDEIHHAELCFGLAGAYAGAELGPGPLPMAGAFDGAGDLATFAVATVEEGCIGETLAALVAEAQRDAAADPAVRAALARIAADEAAHAALAWRFVAWAVAEGPADVRSAVAAAFARAKGPRTLDAGGPPLAGADAAMRAHGRLVEDEVRAVAAHAWTAVILPCAEALVGGGTSPASCAVS